MYNSENGIKQNIKRQKVKRLKSKGRKSNGRKSNRQKINRQKIESQKLLLLLWTPAQRKRASVLYFANVFLPAIR